MKEKTSISIVVLLPSSFSELQMRMTGAKDEDEKAAGLPI